MQHASSEQFKYVNADIDFERKESNMTIDVPNHNNALLEDFQGFVANKMNEPVKGVAELVAKVTPAT